MKEIRVSNIRTEKRGVSNYCLLADISFTGFEHGYSEPQIWFEVDNENAWMYETETYDPFFLVPLYLAMYHNATLVIDGNLSRKLYRNMMEYGQTILCNFSPSLSKVEVSVSELVDQAPCSEGLIGASISCGVDSLSTIFDRYVIEQDEQYRINSLFLFDCGTHGDYEDEKSRRVFEARLRHNSEAAKEIELPVVRLNSNLHAFTHRIGEQKLGYFSIYSCIMSLQSGLKKYYVSSSYSYDEVLIYRNQSHDFDMAEYCEPYLVPLIQTGKLELVLDGAQYKRSEKTANIANWNISKKYLNVCVNPGEDETNCSICSKCERTLFDLEALGLLEEYSQVFDIDAYKRVSYAYKREIVALYGREGFTTDNVNFAKENGLELPSKAEAVAFLALRKMSRLVGEKISLLVRPSS